VRSRKSAPYMRRIYSKIRNADSARLFERCLNRKRQQGWKKSKTQSLNRISLMKLIRFQWHKWLIVTHNFLLIAILNKVIYLICWEITFFLLSISRIFINLKLYRIVLQRLKEMFNLLSLGSLERIVCRPPYFAFYTKLCLCIWPKDKFNSF
jgi:hypothetical protein